MGGLLSSIAWLFGYVLKFWFNVIGNYGWAVIIFSITMKLIIMPLILKQQKSAKKSQEMSSKLQALQNRYKDDQEKLSQEYAKFMKENNFNPFGGCLLMIFQMLILIGVLYVVTFPMKYMDKLSDEEITSELKQIVIDTKFSGDEKTFIEYVDNFIAENSGEDVIKNITKEYSNGEYNSMDVYMQYYKSRNRYHELHILKNKYDLNFFGIDLGTITLEDKGNLKLWIFPILTTIFYYLSLWMVSKKQTVKQTIKDENGNEVEMPNMMMMNITMPLLSGWISASVPQSMGLYWFTNSFLQVIIQLVSEQFSKDDTDKKDKNKDVVIEATNLEKQSEKELEDDNENAIIEEKKADKKNGDKGKNKNSSKKKHKKK